MNYYNLYVFLSFVIGIIGILLGLMNFKLNTANIAIGEKLCRNRIAGGIIWAGCLFWCVPHTEVIIFNSLVPYLYPAAVAVSILSYFFLDYLMSRAFAGSLIIGGYYLVHSSFDYHSKIAILMALVGWGIGIWGIVISAKLVHLLNACSGISLIEAGITIFLRFSQLLKAEYPIFVTLSGIVTSVRL